MMLDLIGSQHGAGGTPNSTEACQWAQPLTPTILLVEDESAVREVTREALEMGGYCVLEANGPEEAAHIAKEPSTQIDLLLTDVVMPGMSGPDLARQMRTLRPGLVTVFMSGYAPNARCFVPQRTEHCATTFRSRLR